MLSAKSYNP